MPSYESTHQTQCFLNRRLADDFEMLLLTPDFETLHLMTSFEMFCLIPYLLEGFLLFYNITLASCPWGPVTANGVDLLTEIYVIYMKTYTSHGAIGLDATDVH